MHFGKADGEKKRSPWLPPLEDLFVSLFPTISRYSVRMCGICGVYDFVKRAPVDREKVQQAVTALAHRGPDDEGCYFDGELGLGNRRLSIIDLPGGHQPLANEDESVWITFNGEIYNYRDLRPGLLARGHQFRTASDTEVILHLYEERGVECLENLRGMFAFALWDRRRRRLFLARDRLGVKPLFYAATTAGLVFASELCALRCLASHAFEAELQSVYDFFTFRYVPSPRTLYRDVFKLPAGNYLLADQHGLQTKAYWDVPAPGDRSSSAEELAEEVMERLREAIRLRLIADVPLGVFLSGGVDSSAIVALMTSLGAAPVRTFSVGFEEPGYSELPFARQVARRCATEHQEVIVRPDDIARELPRLISLRHEPVAEPTDVALYLLARLAAQSVKVVLAGEGGDELFAGYPKYAVDRLAGFVSAVPGSIIRAIESLLPYNQHRARTALRALSIQNEAERSAVWFASFSRKESQELFTREFLAQVDPDHPAEVLAQTLQKDSGRSCLKRMLYADLKIWLPDNLLLRGDHMTMAASIEERVPFLDHKLVELAASIPDRLLASLLHTKLFYRRMLHGHLPSEILHRKKVGFTVPVGLWFKEPLKPMVADLLLSSPASGASYFNAANVRRIVDEHLSGTRDRRKQLWALVNFELWRRQL